MLITTTFGIFKWDEVNAPIKVSDIVVYSVCRWRDHYVCCLSPMKWSNIGIQARVLIMDLQFNVQRTIYCDVDQGHQAIVDNDQLIVADTMHDKLVIVHLETGAVSIRELTKSGKNTLHVNSITHKDNSYYVLFFNKIEKNPSYVDRFDKTWRRIGSFLLPEKGCHNLWFEDSKWATCGSLQGTIMTPDKVIPLSGFTRGYLKRNGFYYVGISDCRGLKFGNPPHRRPGIVKIVNDQPVDVLSLEYINSALNVFDLCEE